MHANHIKQLIEAGLNDCLAIVEGADGVHFKATVISPDFTGKTRIQAQKMVYAILNTSLQNGSLHALSLTTFTPGTWQDKN